MSGHGPAAGPDAADLRQAGYPPVAKLAIGTLALLVCGGVYLAAELNHSTALAVPGTLVGLAVLALFVNLLLLSRIKNFSWSTFWLVARWAVLAYIVIAGLLEFVFIYDHTPARELTLFTVMLAAFAIDIPLLLSFSVARWADLPGDPH